MDGLKLQQYGRLRRLRGYGCIGPVQNAYQCSGFRPWTAIVFLRPVSGVSFSNRKSTLELSLDWSRELHESLVLFKPAINFIASRFGLALEILQYSPNIVIDLDWFPKQDLQSFSFFSFYSPFSGHYCSSISLSLWKTGELPARVDFCPPFCC
jgi:hypothetical protein